VSPAIVFSSVAQPIALEAGTVAVGTNVVVTGWGATSVRLCINYSLA